MKTPQQLILKFINFLYNLHWHRSILLLIVLISVTLFLSITTTTTTTITTGNNPLNILNNLKKALFYNNTKFNNTVNVSAGKKWRKKTGLDQSRIAVCLVGGARRFELTGPSIIENVLKVYPNSDLFLNSPLDSDSYKFSLLKTAPRIAGVRVLEAGRIPETDAAKRVLTAKNSPNGIHGLLQYFSLVEGCLTMIQSYQKQHNFTYDWIVRTRVDGYWSSPLSPKLFILRKYVVPSGSSYGGFNDRFGISDYATSVIALSRLSMIPELDLTKFRNLNSESAFQAQLDIRNITCATKHVPFCVVSDRKYRFPPRSLDVPVASISSKGPLNGAKCRPCTPVCTGRCASAVIGWLVKGWSWTDGGNGKLQLCDANRKWEDKWPEIFDRVAGKKLAAARERVRDLSVGQCVADFEEMRRRTTLWEVPPALDVCNFGNLDSNLKS